MYNELKKLVENYIEFIRGNEFAQYEYERLHKVPETPEELVDAISVIIQSARNLNRLLEQSPTSVYVTDADGVTLRINKCFEELSGIKRKDVRGKKTSDLEEEGVYQPSAISLVLKEKRRITVQQTNVTNRPFIVTGQPVFDEEGNIVMAVTNSLLKEDVERLGRYLGKKTGDCFEPPVKTEIIAESPTMKNILQLADLIKDIGSTIIIEGETGVGKNVLARYIHETSNRKDKKIIEVNCGAIPEALLESELFGYDSGAFTGAKKQGKPGLIELCEGGTILLDEIGEMPMSLQVKLLHFLQNKKIIRVGGTEEIETDVRVIATTNKHLEDMVKEGTFREDLYYRLNVVPFVILPLRERKEDLIPMAQHFVDKYTRLYDRAFQLSEENKQTILANPWKGNIRELENYIERLVVTEGNLDILDKIKLETASSVGEAVTISLANAGETKETVWPRTPKEAERMAVIEAYKKYGSSYKVAEVLGMSQSTAYRKIKKYVTDAE